MPYIHTRSNGILLPEEALFLVERGIWFLRKVLYAYINMVPAYQCSKLTTHCVQITHFTKFIPASEWLGLAFTAVG